jgi:hypothetical protein
VIRKMLNMDNSERTLRSFLVSKSITKVWPDQGVFVGRDLYHRISALLSVRNCLNVI